MASEQKTPTAPSQNREIREHARRTYRPESARRRHEGEAETKGEFVFTDWASI